LLATENLNFIRRTAAEFGAKRVLLFGSSLGVSEDEANDIDLAVEGLDSLTAYNFMLQLFKAPELKGKPVDVVRLEAKVPILPIILDEGVEIYDDRETTLS
jgi:predicted nucleotidyltransferase